MKPIILKHYPLKVKEEPLFDESSDVLQTKQQRKYHFKSLTKIPLDNDFNFSLSHTPTKTLTQACLQEVDQKTFGFAEKMNNKAHISFLSKMLKRSRKLTSLTTICFENEIEAIETLKYSLNSLKDLKKMKVHFLLLADQTIMQYWLNFMRKIFRQHRLTHLAIDIFIKSSTIPNVIKLLKGISRIKTLECLSINLFSTSPLSECSRISQILRELASLITSLGALKHFALNFPNIVDKHQEEIYTIWSALRSRPDLQSLQVNINLQNSLLTQNIQQTFQTCSQLTVLEATLDFYSGISSVLEDFFHSISPVLKSLEINLITRSQHSPPTREDWCSLVNGICSLENLEDLKYQYQSDRASQDYLSILVERVGCLKKLANLEIGGEGELGNPRDKRETFETLTKLLSQTKSLTRLGIEFHVFNSERKFKNDWLCLFASQLSEFSQLKALKLVLGETPCTDQFLECLKNMLIRLSNIRALEIDIGSRRFSNKGIMEFGRGFEEFAGALDQLQVTLAGGKIRKGVKCMINSLVKKIRTQDVEIMVELCNEDVDDNYEDIFYLLNGSPYSKQWKLDIFDF